MKIKFSFQAKLIGIFICCYLITLGAFSQGHYFTKFSGFLTPTTGYLKGSAYQVVRLHSGELVTMTRNDDGLLIYRVHDSTGAASGQFQLDVAPFNVHEIYRIEPSLDGLALYVLGLTDEPAYFIGRLEIASKEIRFAKFPLWEISAGISIAYSNGNSIHQDSSGIYVVMPIWNYGLCAKYSTDLDPIWCKGFYVGDTTGKYVSFSMASTDTSLVLCTKEYSTLGIVEIDGAGNVLSHITYPSPYYTRGLGITKVKGDGFLFTGDYNYAPFVSKIRNDWSVAWTKKYNDTYFDSFSGAFAEESGMIYVFGSVGAFETDAINGVVTLDSNGNKIAVHVQEGCKSGFPFIDSGGVATVGYTDYGGGLLKGFLEYCPKDFAGACISNSKPLGVVSLSFGPPTFSLPASVSSFSKSILPPTGLMLMTPTPLPLFTDCAPLGRDEEGIPHFGTLTPNPVLRGERFRIPLQHCGNYQVVMRDGTGHKLWESNSNMEVIEIETIDLSSGLYYVQINCGEGYMARFKVLII